MLSDLPGPVAIVAHDAGGANQLLAWLDAATADRLRPCLVGPALALWQRAGRGPVLSLEEALDGAAVLLSGTGWASDLEHDARRLARQRGIHAIAVLDHWTNYPARFERHGSVVLPDELWVTDEEALALARATFPEVPVRLQPNAYLAAQVAEVHARAASCAPGEPPHVLYVLEPIRAAWGAPPELDGREGEFAALDFFMSGLDRAGVPRHSRIRLRPHPSDPPGKYDAWLAHQGELGLDIALDTHDTLAAALGWADTVVGCQTYAMVVALAAGRRVISTVPPWAPPCVLPQSGIEHLSAVAPFYRRMPLSEPHALTTQVSP